MTELTHLECPDKTECGSSDAYTWNDTKEQGYCHSCELKTWTFKGELWGKRGTAKGKPLESSTNMATQSVVEDFTPKAITETKGSFVGTRGITSSTMEKFGVRTTGDKQEYPYPSGGIKTRNLTEKAFSTTQGFKTDELFGMNLFPVNSSRIVTIVEGELDAMSSWQMLTQGSTYANPVVSLPSATPSGKLWEKCKGWLDSFEKIILSVDNDDAGKRVAETMFDLFPSRVYMMDHGNHKDANDFLQAGDQKAYKSAWWGAKKYSPAGFTASVEDWMSAIDGEDPYEYTPTPIDAYNKIGKGLVKGGITVVKAPPGTGKCLGPDVPVMMADGSIKKAKEVVVGDYLMGDDSTPRKVLSTTAGFDDMYKIVPTKGESWACNSEHVLSLFHNGRKEVVDVPMKEYLKAGSDFVHRAKQYRAEVSNFGPVDWNHKFMAPYAYGVFVGDGSRTRSTVYFGLKKKEVMDHFIRLVEDSGFICNPVWQEDKNCWNVNIKSGSGKHGSNSFIKFDRSLVDLYKKDIPWVRKQFLAGILDTDGYLTCNCYDLVQKDIRVAEAVVFSARSIGLAAYMTKVTKGIKGTGFKGDYYRVSISGDISIIPTIRHKPKERKQIKDVLKTGFTVEHLGIGQYFGFELDGNHRFLLGDFTVTHNSSFLRKLMHDLVVDKKKVVAALMMEEVKSVTGRAMATYQLGKNVKTKEDASFNGVSEEEVKEALMDVLGEERFVSFDVNPQDPVEDTLKQCKYAISVYNAEYIFIDHLQRLAYLMGTDTATSSLTELGVKLTELAKRRNVGIVCISHVNSEGKTKYAGSIEEEAIVMIEMSRDKKADDVETRNTTLLEITKNRPYALTGEAGMLKYDVETDMVTERLGPREPKTDNKGDF